MTDILLVDSMIAGFGFTLGVLSVWAVVMLALDMYEWLELRLAMRKFRRESHLPISDYDLDFNTMDKLNEGNPYYRMFSEGSKDGK